MRFLDFFFFLSNSLALQHSSQKHNTSYFTQHWFLYITCHLLHLCCTALSPPSSSLLSFWVVSPGSAWGGVSQAELQQCVGGLTSYPLFPLLSSTHPPLLARRAVFRVSQRCSEFKWFLASQWPGHSTLKEDSRLHIHPSTLLRVGHRHFEAFGQLSCPEGKKIVV